jgi:hypothetical protein
MNFCDPANSDPTGAPKPYFAIVNRLIHSDLLPKGKTGNHLGATEIDRVERLANLLHVDIRCYCCVHHARAVQVQPHVVFLAYLRHFLDELKWQYPTAAIVLRVFKAHDLRDGTAGIIFANQVDELVQIKRAIVQIFDLLHIHAGHLRAEHLQINSMAGRTLHAYRAHAPLFPHVEMRLVSDDYLAAAFTAVDHD